MVRLVAYSSLTQQQITISLAESALKDLIPDSKPKKITIPLIKKNVAEEFDLEVSDLVGRKRTRAIAFPRQIAMYLSREMTDNSLPKIGEKFGGRDHSTVIHAHEKVSKRVSEDPEFRADLDELKGKMRK